MPQPKQSFVQRVIRWRFFVVVNLVIALMIGMSLGREVVRNRTIAAEIYGLQQEAESLAARNIEISELRTAMQSESFIEREARLKLGMQLPGETVVVISDEGTATTISDDPNDPLGLVIDETTNFDSVANTTKWWYYFFDKDRFNQIVAYE